MYKAYGGIEDGQQAHRYQQGCVSKQPIANTVIKKARRNADSQYVDGGWPVFRKNGGNAAGAGKDEYCYVQQSQGWGGLHIPQEQKCRNPECYKQRAEWNTG
jgi:hypothetical protein